MGHNRSGQSIWYIKRSIQFVIDTVAGKEIYARFDGGRLSADGGVLLLHGIEQGLGLADVLASCLTDERAPWCTTHSQADMIRARMFAIACGYEDCDDLDALRFDPAFKLACGRLVIVLRDGMTVTHFPEPSRNCPPSTIC